MTYRLHSVVSSACVLIPVVTLVLFCPYCDSVWWGAGMVICLERDADLHMAQRMLLPLTASCFSKIQIGFSFLVPAHLGGSGQRAAKRVCVCVCDSVCLSVLCLFVIVINIIYVQATSYDGVFLLAAFHCTALICNYCLSLLLINIYRSIYLHEEGTERDMYMTVLRKNSSVFSLIRMRRLPSARAVKLCTNKILQFLAGGAG